MRASPLFFLHTIAPYANVRGRPMRVDAPKPHWLDDGFTDPLPQVWLPGVPVH